jgi:PIN domain nuclease of toxin-antitoxin system
LKLLLDTHILLWWLSGSPKLGRRALGMLTSPAADLSVSAATWWEIGIKRAIGRMAFDWTVGRTILNRNQVKTILVTFEHAEAAAGLPLRHRDPFGRMLVAQAELEGMKLLTRDKHLKAYGPDVLYV